MQGLQNGIKHFLWVGSICSVIFAVSKWGLKEETVKVKFKGLIQPHSACFFDDVPKRAPNETHGYFWIKGWNQVDWIGSAEKRQKDFKGNPFKFFLVEVSLSANWPKMNCHHKSKSRWAAEILWAIFQIQLIQGEIPTKFQNEKFESFWGLSNEHVDADICDRIARYFGWPLNGADQAENCKNH